MSFHGQSVKSQQRRTNIGPTAKERAYEYFRDLDQSDLSVFERKSSAVEQYSLSATQIAKSIRSIATNLTDKEQINERNDRYEGVFQAIKKHQCKWENAVLSKINSFSATNLNMVLYGIASMGLVPSEQFMERVRDRAEQVYAHQNARYLRRYLWSLAVIDRLNPNPENKQHFEKLREFAKAPIRDVTKKQLYDADLWFRKTSDIENPHRKGHSHDTEKMLCKAFLQAGFRAKLVKRGTIPELPNAIDIEVTNQDGDKTVYIEADGLIHFLNTGRDENKHLIYNGHTLLRSGLMAEFGSDMHILHIDDDMIKLIESTMKSGAKHKKSDEFLSDRLCRSIFQQTAKKDPGIYTVRADCRPGRACKRAPRIDQFFVSQPRLEFVH